MELVEKSGLSYQCCKGCKSIWIGNPEFLALMEQVRPGQDNELLVHNDGTPRRPCLICAEAMDIAWILFLQMDRCEEHGIWFDPGEFSRALEGDVGSEVLDQVKRRDQQRRQAEKRGQGPVAPGSWLGKLRDFFLRK